MRYIVPPVPQHSTNGRQGCNARHFSSPDIPGTFNVARSLPVKESHIWIVPSRLAETASAPSGLTAQATMPARSLPRVYRTFQVSVSQICKVDLSGEGYQLVLSAESMNFPSGLMAQLTIFSLSAFIVARSWSVSAS